MKINQVGIQNYQQLGRQENAKPFVTNNDTDSDSDNAISIEPKSSLPSSSLAVKMPSGTFADSLTTEERQALEMLFAKFRESGRFSAGYKGGSEAVDEVGLGRIVDVKV
jgi:hypothetical protein